MPSNINWGQGGATAGGSGVLIGSDTSGSPGGRLNADGAELSREVVIGEGGATAGGEAEVSD